MPDLLLSVFAVLLATLCEHGLCYTAVFTSLIEHEISIIYPQETSYDSHDR